MKKLTAAAAAAAMVGALTMATAGPAAADELCSTTENAPFYASIGGTGGEGYLFTLSPGRGFRAIGVYIDVYQRPWIHGHGAEHPDREGWVLGSHTNC